VWLFTPRTPVIAADLAQLAEPAAGDGGSPAGLPFAARRGPALAAVPASRLGFLADLVESVQKRHEVILRRLGKRHRRLTVYVEGLTEPFVEKAKQLTRVDCEDILETRQMPDELRTLRPTSRNSSFTSTAKTS
jgi:hypothetical protein